MNASSAELPAVHPIAAAELYSKTWEALKREVGEVVVEVWATERNTLLLCGAIWGYLGSSTAPTPGLFWFVPVALVAFGIIRVAALMISINPRARYLRRLEDESLMGKSIEGWEAYRWSHFRRGVGTSMILFWSLLLAASVFMVVQHTYAN